MKGKVKYAKFPPGLYYCQIEDVKAGINSKQEDIIVVTYRIQQGERTDQTFKERLNSVSSGFLKGIGEPCDYNATWDTENWRGKFVWVDVKYSEDEAQWPRYGHYAQDPTLKAEPPIKSMKKAPIIPPPTGVPAGVGDDDIPF